MDGPQQAGETFIAVAAFEVVLQEIGNLDFERVAARLHRRGDVEVERRSPGNPDLVSVHHDAGQFKDLSQFERDRDLGAEPFGRNLHVCGVGSASGVPLQLR